MHTCMQRPPETAMMSGKGLYFPPQHASINFASSVYLLELGIGNTDGKGFVMLFLAQHSSICFLVIIRIIRCQNLPLCLQLSVFTDTCESSTWIIRRMESSAYGHVSQCMDVKVVFSFCTAKLHWTYTNREDIKAMDKTPQSLECLCIGHSRLSVSCCCSLCGWSSWEPIFLCEHSLYSVHEK